ncbi:MAG: pantoate--beta-alanine ligase [Candidatus Sumerlaeia bacterium]|nr:pantoate--beta-alanine ligase [Candidatus Sumerlaeia bacterium]
MQIIGTAEEMRVRARSLKRDGKKIVLVPTMGALHRGHEKLIQEGRQRGDVLVVSNFVNPIQFDDQKDLSAYPRTVEQDRAICQKHGADIVFEPTAEEMYPPGFLTTVNVSFLSKKLEGEHRPGHFRGVCTVVLKLFNMTKCDVAVFGWKDAQQFIILKHMVNDLAMDVELVGIPTVRDADGLALSSRNVRLKEEQRTHALALNRALKRCHFLVRKQGITHSGELLQAVRSALSTASVQTDYAAIVSRTTLEPIDMIEQGNTLVALAVRIGDVRLIDNTRF